MLAHLPRACPVKQRKILSSNSPFSRLRQPPSFRITWPGLFVLLESSTEYQIKKTDASGPVRPHGDSLFDISSIPGASSRLLLHMSNRPVFPCNRVSEANAVHLFRIKTPYSLRTVSFLYIIPYFGAALFIICTVRLRSFESCDRRGDFALFRVFNGLSPVFSRFMRELFRWKRADASLHIAISTCTRLQHRNDSTRNKTEHCTTPTKAKYCFHPIVLFLFFLFPLLHNMAEDGPKSVFGSCAFAFVPGRSLLPKTIAEVCHPVSFFRLVPQ